MVSLRSIFFYKYDRSTQRLSTGGSRRAEFLNFRHFRSFLILAHLLLQALFLSLNLYRRALNTFLR